ncbi:MAG: dihydrodipicolinate synthase family protein [Clostridia bacterium]|nr:dihydrodipicolinate synthase family protein [Clostridia bacterium]
MIKFKGIMPALVTPLDENERVKVDVLHSLIDYLLGQGADGFYVGGATGEGLALRKEERMILAEEAVKTVNKKKPVIIQVASTVFPHAIELAKHAENIGADAISATPPLFFGYDEDDVYNYYKKLAESVHIPVMIYYNPGAGFKFNAKIAAKMFEIDNITAIKWTSSDYYEMIRLKDITNGEMNIINGPDEMLLMGLNAGADGGIGTTYNFMFDIIKAVYDNFEKGNLAKAQEMQNKADRIIAELKKYRAIPGTKAILEEMGFNVGNAAFPMKRYDEETKKTLFKAVKNAGLEI